MTIKNIFGRSTVEKKVPTDIYFSVVNALFAEKKSLLFGALSTFVAVILTAWRANSVPLLILSFAAILVGILRWLDALEFDRVKSALSIRSDMERWERRYTAGAAFSSAILGAWCFYSSVYVADSVVLLIAITVTISNVIGIFGRNFSIKRLVNVQFLFFSIPLFAGLLLQWNLYHLALGLMLIPLISSAKSIADRLRSTLLAAVIGHNEVNKLARQLDAALNNMPQGLCMFDGEASLVVANDQASELLGVNLTQYAGVSLQGLIGRCVKNNRLSLRDSRRLFKHLSEYRSHKELVRKSHIPPLKIRFVDGKILQFSFKRMENGGTVAVFEDISERVAADRKIKHLARYDSLTGLPNRAFFRATMNNALSKCDENHHCAVLALDIDEFKQVNDTLGHPVGDELLRRVAERLKGGIGPSHPVSRFGGDEFVVLLPELRSKKEAIVLAETVIRSLKDPFRVNGHDIVISASIGIASTVDEVANVDVLLRNADLALYRSKAECKGSAQFYAPEMGTQLETRLNLENDLRIAVKKNELDLYFQPLVNVETQRITTCEALIRWRHPVMGDISPTTFIPVAEDMGLIVEIGDWVLNRACDECLTWPGNVRVAVNLSALQFKRGDVVKSVKNALKRSGLPANRLELEITESVMLQDIAEARVVLEKLEKIGVRISLDDFGTGFSSLSYLHNLPLHKVKIDRSFVQNINTDKKSLTLCKNIAQMGTQLGLAIVVEGVETEEQLNTIVREVAVNEIQGFLYSPALSAKNILEIVTASAGSRMSFAEKKHALKN